MPLPQSRSRLPFVAVLLLIALSFPILTIVNVPRKVWGIPVLYVYVFAAWLIAILAMMFTGKAEKQDS